jgi:hypothetical protein
MPMVVYTHILSLPALTSATIERYSEQVPVRHCPLVRKRDLSRSFLLLLSLYSCRGVSHRYLPKMHTGKVWDSLKYPLPGNIGQIETQGGVPRLDKPSCGIYFSSD